MSPDCKVLNAAKSRQFRREDLRPCHMHCYATAKPALLAVLT
jgi:hypothetical protein